MTLTYVQVTKHFAIERMGKRCHATVTPTIALDLPFELGPALPSGWAKIGFDKWDETLKKLRTVRLNFQTSLGYEFAARVAPTLAAAKAGCPACTSKEPLVALEGSPVFQFKVVLGLTGELKDIVQEVSSMVTELEYKMKTPLNALQFFVCPAVPATTFLDTSFTQKCCAGMLNCHMLRYTCTAECALPVNMAALECLAMYCDVATQCAVIAQDARFFQPIAPCKEQPASGVASLYCADTTQITVALR